MEAVLPVAYGFALVLMRCAGLCAFAPILGSHLVPARVRLAVALGVSVAAWSAGGVGAIEPPDRFGELLLAAGFETALGALTGLTARFTLDAALAAGALGGLSMGLGLAALIDPINGAEATAVSQLFSMIALAFAVALGLHREAIAWVCRTVTLFPPGTPYSLDAVVAAGITHTVGAIALAVRLALPIVSAVTLGHVVLGLLGRMAPQLSLASLGFSVAILAGGWSLFFVVPIAAEIASNAAIAVFQAR